MKITIRSYPDGSTEVDSEIPEGFDIPELLFSLSDTVFHRAVDEAENSTLTALARVTTPIKERTIATVKIYSTDEESSLRMEYVPGQETGAETTNLAFHVAVGRILSNLAHQMRVEG